MTGGTGVAKERNWSALPRCHNDVVGVLVSLEIVDVDALFVSWFMGFRKAIVRTRYVKWSYDLGITVRIQRLFVQLVDSKV